MLLKILLYYVTRDMRDVQIIVERLFSIERISLLFAAKTFT